MNSGKNARSGSGKVRGDAEDQLELEQLLAGPHRVVFKGSSPYQDILVLESDILRMYVDGELAFDLLDEKLYYEHFVHPACKLASSRERILVVEGWNGLALREILQYRDVQEVDWTVSAPDLLALFRQMPKMTARNNGAFADRRVAVHEGGIRNFLSQDKKFNLIFLDYPLLTCGNVNRLYTEELFRSLYGCLSEGGILVCPSLPPTEEPYVFSVSASVLQHTGFHALNYRISVPSRGDLLLHFAGKTPFTQQTAQIEGEEIPSPLESNASLPPPPDQQYTPYTFLREKLSTSGAKKKTMEILQRLALLYDTFVKDDEGDDLEEIQDAVELHQMALSQTQVVYRGESEYGELLLLESKELRMYLDGQLQFCSTDERIYHEALVHPALLMARERKRILILGGGDGLALREVLKYPDVEHVDLVDIDPVVIDAAQRIPEIVALNGGSLLDHRTRVHIKDARKFIRQPLEPYDAILIDFPDPSDEVIAGLYSKEFYLHLSRLLAPHGILACQACTPTEAPVVYWSIAATLESAGFQTLSYHVYVPSFYEWGFHLARRETEAADPSVFGSDAFPRSISPLTRFPGEISKYRPLARINREERLTLHEMYREELGH